MGLSGLAGLSGMAGVAGSLTYLQRVLAIAPANLIQALPMNEPSGSTATDASGNGRNGAYTNVTLGATGIGDGNTAASFNGTTSLMNGYSTSYRDAFNKDEGSMVLWAKIADWTAPALSQNIWRNRADTSNSLDINRPASANRLNATYLAGGTSKQCNIQSFSPAGWFSLGLTWSKAADTFTFYVNGSTSGVTTPTQTGLGTWSGTLSSGGVLVGVSTTAPANPWPGTAGMLFVWSTPLTAGQMLSAGTL